MQMLIDSTKKNFGVRNAIYISILLNYAFILLFYSFIKAKIGLIINLTNSNRYYDSQREVTQQGIKFVKISCKGYVLNLKNNNKL